MSGNNYRSISKIFGVLSGTTSRIMHSSEDELTSETHSSERGEVLVKVTPRIVSDLLSSKFDNPQVTQHDK